MPLGAENLVFADYLPCPAPHDCLNGGAEVRGLKRPGLQPVTFDHLAIIIVSGARVQPMCLGCLIRDRTNRLRVRL